LEAVAAMPQHAFEIGQAGAMIRGTAYRPEGAGRFPAVLMLHGFTGQRIESGFMFVQIARALNQRGVAAVTFDFLNSGESDGSFDQMLATGELDDAMRMTRWLTSQPFVDRSRLGILGFSLGGLLAACVCGRTDLYRAMVMLAPTTVTNMCRHAGRQSEYHDGTCQAPPGVTVTIGPHALNGDFFSDIQTLDPLADVVAHPRPTLVVQGTGDTAVPPSASGQFVEAMRQIGVPVDHELIDDADHSFNRPEWRQRMVERVAAWTAQHLSSA
jgi:uncharacterized protein